MWSVRYGEKRKDVVEHVWYIVFLLLDFLQIKNTLYSMTVPVTTRPMADGEVNGREYDFVSVKEFEQVGYRCDRGSKARKKKKKQGTVEPFLSEFRRCQLLFSPGAIDDPRWRTGRVG